MSCNRLLLNHLNGRKSRRKYNVSTHRQCVSFISAGDVRVGTEIGQKIGDGIRIQSSNFGYAVYGGYVDLSAGSYQAIIWLDNSEDLSGCGLIEVCVGHGQWVAARSSFDSRTMSTVAPFLCLPFELFQAAEAVEVRARATSAMTATISSIEILTTTSPPQIAAIPAREIAITNERESNFRKLNILYYPVHEVLEYDELRMLTDLGHRVFSVGSYCNPYASDFPRKLLRPRLSQFYYPGDYEQFQIAGLTRAFVDQFDVAIIMQSIEAVSELRKVSDNIPIVYRSIGQSNTTTEAQLYNYADDVHIVRYSDRERYIAGFVPTDHVIYFGKYIQDFPEWVGGDQIVTFHNNYLLRAGMSVPTLEQFAELSSHWPIDLYGLNTDEIQNGHGAVSSEKQSELLRMAALCLYVSTVPPSYTLTLMEAMAHGTPILVPSADFVLHTVGSSTLSANTAVKSRYEFEALLGDDSSLIFSSLEDAHVKIGALLRDVEQRAEISKALRQRFTQVFDAVKISRQWNDLLQSIC